MELIDIFLHIDEYLGLVVDLFGPWTYVILFAVIFAETGLVVTPFLPGDSLLFAVGALAGAGFLNIGAVYVSLLAAAVLGDTVNYWAGYYIGPRVFAKENSRLFNKAYLEKTREFYERHGGTTIILARFLPIIRTFAPFVAGIGRMRYRTFFLYNIVGAVAWVTSMTGAGYLFGGLPFVKANFEFFVIGIVILSILPMIFEYIRHRRGPALAPEQLEHATYEDIRETLRQNHLDTPPR